MPVRTTPAWLRMPPPERFSFVDGTRRRRGAAGDAVLGHVLRGRRDRAHDRGRLRDAIQGRPGL